MFEYINIFLKSVFIDNMIFAYFLGMCSFLAVSKKVSTAIGLGIAVTFVQVITVPLNYLIYHYVLDGVNLTGAKLSGLKLTLEQQSKLTPEQKEKLISNPSSVVIDQETQKTERKYYACT